MRLIISGSLAVVALLGVTLLSHCHSTARASEQVPTQSDSTDPISGKWDVSFLINGHVTPATFELKLDGTKVTGTANSDHTGLGTVRDGTWDKGKLSFTLDFKKHESIAITGAIKESKLIGEFRTEGFVTNWEATKKP